MSDERNYEGSERRRDSRVPLKVPVDYSSVDDFFTEFSANINEGGVFVAMEKPPELDSEVHLQFRLPGADQPVLVNGRVAWTSDGEDGEPAGFGVEFQDLPGEIREAINGVVRNLRTKD
jgi:uncharacterized protein (TIGR02266 family)